MLFDIPRKRGLHTFPPVSHTFSRRLSQTHGDVQLQNQKIPMIGKKDKHNNMLELTYFMAQIQ